MEIRKTNNLILRIFLLLLLLEHEENDQSTNLKRKLNYWVVLERSREGRIRPSILKF